MFWAADLGAGFFEGLELEGVGVGSCKCVVLQNFTLGGVEIDPYHANMMSKYSGGAASVPQRASLDCEAINLLFFAFALALSVPLSIAKRTTYALRR
jgi:hypothetical protein